MAASLTPRTGQEDDVSMIAEEALANPYVVVALGTDPNGVVICGTSAIPYGITQEKQATVGAPVRVRPISCGGESFVRANGVFAKGDQLGVAAADGEVDTTTSGEAVGLALEEATAAGDEVVANLFNKKL